MRSIGPAVTREQSPAFLRNSNGRLDLPGPSRESEDAPQSYTMAKRKSSDSSDLLAENSKHLPLQTESMRSVEKEEAKTEESTLK